MQVFNNPANYKPCYKKQYDIWVCMPPPGTIVVSILEQPATVSYLGGKTYFTSEDLADLAKTRPQTIQVLQQLVAAKKCYCTSPGDMVLSGTRGELWIAKKEKVASTYQFYHNDQLSSNWADLFKRRGVMKDGVALLPWVKVHSMGKNASPTMACFVENDNKKRPSNPADWTIKAWGADLEINAKGVGHGLGDFVVCEAVMVGGKLKPAIGADGSWNRWVVNGEVFADTYNNQGWANCIKPSGDLSALPKPDDLFTIEPEEEVVFDEGLYKFVGGLATQCSKEQHRELSFSVSRGAKPNQIELRATTIMDFAQKNSSSEFKTVKVATQISVNKNNTVTFKNFLSNAEGFISKTPTFTIVVPRTLAEGEVIDKAVTEEFLAKNVEVVFGLCGFVREVGVRSSFKTISDLPDWKLTQADYSGLRDYTMTSGATNRKLRGLTDYKGEQHGEGMAAAIRTIANCDSVFNKVASCRPLRVFRGEPFEDRQVKCGYSFDELGRYYSVNTAYSSTTLNVQSAPMFAKKNGAYGGVIWAIDLEPGTHAIYAHNVAGWKQQYEILLDRRYDLKVEDILLEFEDSSHYKYRVVKGSLVKHPAFGPIDANQSGALRQNMNKFNYDHVGRVSFESEYAEGVLHEAYNKIRQKGYSHFQWQAEFDSDKEILENERKNGEPPVNTKTTTELLGDTRIHVEAAIVLRANNPDMDKKGVHIDYGITLAPDGRALIVHRIKGKTSIRQYHGMAEDLSWSEYGVNRLDVAKTYDGDKLISVDGAKDINEFDQDLYDSSGRDKRNILPLQTGTSDEIAQRIIKWGASHKNVCMLPLIDVGRYFDTAFAQCLSDEGYELMRSIRVERHYDKSSQVQVNDPQAGYVPCKYQINGDNDDHLVIDVKFERDKDSGRLKISYRGQSQGTKVNETKSLTVAIFTGDHMYNLSRSIIYTFAKKMHLSKARKFDNLLKYFCYQTGYKLGRPEKKDEGVVENYRVWDEVKKTNFTVDIIKQDAEHYQAVVEFADKTVKFIDMDFSNTIFMLYHQFYDSIFGGDDNVVTAQS